MSQGRVGNPNAGSLTDAEIIVSATSSHRSDNRRPNSLVIAAFRGYLAATMASLTALSYRAHAITPAYEDGDPELDSARRQAGQGA